MGDIITSTADIPTSWEPALSAAIALAASVPPADVSASFLPAFGSAFQLWIRVSNLDGTTTPTPYTACSIRPRT